MEIKTPHKVKGDLEFDIIEITQEYVISKMPITPGMLNPFGTVQAGATSAERCSAALYRRIYMQCLTTESVANSAQPGSIFQNN